MPEKETIEAAIIESRLKEKIALLREMLEASVVLKEALVNENGRDDLGAVASQAVAVRWKLIYEIDQIDRELKGADEVYLDRNDDMRRELQELFSKLNEIQTALEGALIRQRDSVKDSLQTTVKTRKNLKGYFDESFASRPRFTDDRG